MICMLHRNDPEFNQAFDQIYSKAESYEPVYPSTFFMETEDQINHDIEIKALAYIVDKFMKTTYLDQKKLTDFNFPEQVQV